MTTFTVTATHSAVFVLDNGVTYANGTALVKVDTGPGLGQYSVASGVYTFAAADASAHVLVSYLYASIPADIIDAALRLITGRFKARGRDPMLRSQGDPGIVGTKQFWVGPLPGQNGAIPPEVAGILDIYRTPSVG